MVGPRLPLGEDLIVGHAHARGAADTEGSSLSPRIKRRIRAKTSLAEIERKERGRTNIPGPPRLRTLVTDAAEVPISEGSLVPVSTPTSGPQRAHPYTPVGDAVGSSSFEMVPPVRARAPAIGASMIAQIQSQLRELIHHLRSFKSLHTIKSRERKIFQKTYIRPTILTEMPKGPFSVLKTL